MFSVDFLLNSEYWILNSFLTIHRHPYRPGHHHVEQSQRDQDLPAEMHELIVAWSRHAATHPDKNKGDQQNLDDEPDDRRQERTMPATEEKHRGHGTDDA